MGLLHYDFRHACSKPAAGVKLTCTAYQYCVLASYAGTTIHVHGDLQACIHMCTPDNVQHMCSGRAIIGAAAATAHPSAYSYTHDTDVSKLCIYLVMNCVILDASAIRSTLS
jgi:hypothetical protein